MLISGKCEKPATGEGGRNFDRYNAERLGRRYISTEGESGPDLSKRRISTLIQAGWKMVHY